MSVFVGSEFFISGCTHAARNPRGTRLFFIDHFKKNWLILGLSILMCSEEFLAIIVLRVDDFLSQWYMWIKKA